MNGTTNQTTAPPLVRQEVMTSLVTYFTHRFDTTSALMMVELGYGRTQVARVHNVPEEMLDIVVQEGRRLRPIILDALATDAGAAIALKRVVIGSTEFYLTAN